MTASLPLNKVQDDFGDVGRLLFGFLLYVLMTETLMQTKPAVFGSNLDVHGC